MSEAKRLAKEGIWRWDDFKLQLDDYQRGFFDSARESCSEHSPLQEVRIGPIRYAVGKNIVMLMKPKPSGTTTGEPGAD